MTNYGTYTFSKPGHGSLELDISAPSKKVYGNPLSDSIPFTTSGLDGSATNPVGPIYFFEWQKISYSYYINLSDENLFLAPFRLLVNDRIEKESRERGEGVHILSGDFSFNDQVGETTIKIVDGNNRKVFTLHTEVFPQKMDYKSDYQAMMGEIAFIVENLAFDALKDTFRESKARLSGRTTQNEWWNILDALFGQMVINLGVIKRQPKHEIRTREQVLSVDRIKQTSKRNVDWLRKNTQFINQENVGVKFTDTHFASHALSCKKYVTYDTYENRFIAWAIRNTIEHLRKYKKYTEISQGNRDYSILLNRMKYYQSKLQGILHESPFNEVGQFEKRARFSTSLTRGAGYRDFMQIYLLLSRGLEIANNDIFKIEQKDISTLYEYWCFLKLVHLLKEQNGSEIDFRNLIKIDSNGFHVNLKKGESSKVIFRKQETGETTTIYFNKEFSTVSGKSFTYNQRPDYALEFKKKGYDKPFWYLFDAKYRFDEQSENDNNQYNVPQDAIGQLHRYRDAILHTNANESSYRSAIKNLGGIILYPYPLSESLFTKNAYFKSIRDVNIGALPLLPSKTQLLSDFLKDLINRTAETHFEEYIEMDMSEYKRNRDLWSEHVTIGVVPSEFQENRLKFLSDNALYHVPFVEDNNSRLYGTKKILICISGTEEAVLYYVSRWEILTRDDLENLGAKWGLRSLKYVVFHLTKGEVVTLPEKLSSLRGYRYATQEGLKRYINGGSKDRRLFYLTNPDAARLYDELLKKEKQFDINWVKNSHDSSLIEFKIGDHKVRSSEQFDVLKYEINGQKVVLNTVLSLVCD